MEANQKFHSMHKTFKDDFIKKMVKDWNKKGNATSSTTHTEKALKQPSALVTASLSTNTLSREFIRLTKISFEVGDLIKSFHDLSFLNSPSGCLCARKQVHG